MHRRTLFLLAFMLSAVCRVAAAPPDVSRNSLPRVGGVPVVATVNGEGIALDDVERQVALFHLQAGDAKPTSQDPSELLERMIAATLIAQEARAAGLDETTEVRASIEEVEKSLLRDLLVGKWTEGLKVTPAEVDAAYKDRVREHVMQLVFVKNEHVKEFDEQIRAGAEFTKLAKTFRGLGKARGPEAPEPHKLADLTPPLAKMLSSMKPGQTSPPQPGKGESLFIHLAEIRYPDRPEARADARSDALEKKRDAVVKQRTAELRTRYATIDKDLLRSLDFNKKGSTKALEGDKRPLVRIRGEAPITVGDLAKAMERRFFHGLDAAIGAQKVNEEKEPVLEDQINRRVVILEARARKLDQGGEFKSRLGQRTREILFEAYLQQAVIPEVKISDDDLKSYFAEHQKEYTKPEMVRLEGVAFGSRSDAEAALSKLQRGADVKWLKANAPGRLEPGTSDEAMLSGAPIQTAQLPDWAQKALKGAKAGDAKLFAEGTSGPYYVVLLRDLQAAEPLTLDAVRDEIRGLVREAKLKKAIEDTASLLRKQGVVKIHATGDTLRSLIKSDMGSGS